MRFHQWEYRAIRHETLTEQFGPTMTDDDFIVFLNALGSDGWEWIGHMNFSYFFKRPVDWLLGG